MEKGGIMSKGIIFRNHQNEKIYPCPYMPIGSIYFSTDSRNPTDYFGGTWERFSKGRVIVGIDENQSEFNSANKTGGSKYLQQHKHFLKYTADNHKYADTSNGGDNHQDFGSLTHTGFALRTLWPHSGWERQAISSDVMNINCGDSGNLQPYICVYIWRRTA